METIKTSLEHKTARYDKGSLLSVLPLILLPFTFFLFGPIEMVLRNTVSLWFTWLDILPILLVCFALCFVVLCFIGLMLPKKIRRYFIALFWGFGFATYVQGNVLQVEYGIMDGTPVLWEEFAQWAIINTIIWCVLSIVPVIAVRLWYEISQKIMIYITCVILTVLVGTSVVLILQAPLGQDVELILTDEHLFTVSDNKNIVVLVLDSFDTAFMHGLLEEEPELKEMLDGFTFFDNTLGMFPTTKGGMPHILTGIPNLNTMPFTEYLDVAFSSVLLYPKLYEHGFNTFIHTMPLLISPLVTNYIGNAHTVEWIISDAVGLFSNLFRFAGMRYFPHLLKERVWTNISSFDNYRTSTEHGAGFRLSNVFFHNRLVQDGLSVDPNTNVFLLIHLFGVHASVEADDIVNFARQGEVSTHDRARGALQIAMDFLSQLQEVGVDNNTLFIVMADHGLSHLNHRPLLLIRDPAHTAPFSISSVPISYQDIIPMLEAYVAEEATALTYLNRASLSNDTRVFFYYHWDDTWDSRYLPTISEYIFTDGSADFANAQLLQPTYYLGSTIYFAQSHDAFDEPQRYFLSGLGKSEDSHTWSSGQTSIFSIRPNEPLTSDLRLDLTFGIFGSQRIRLYAGNQFIDEREFEQTDEWITNTTFAIPLSSVDADNNIMLRFEFPDAARPVDVVEEAMDTRILAIAFMEMTISQTE